MENDKDLDKLGTVLAVSNQIHRDMLNMLKQQQETTVAEQADLRRMLERQQIRQWGIIVFAILIMAMSMYQTRSVINHVDNVMEALQHEHQAAIGTGLSK